MDFSITEEQQRLVDTARKFTKEKIIPVAQKLDEHGTFPKEICEQGWELGLMNGEVPQAYGGLELTTVDHVLMMKAQPVRPKSRKVGLKTNRVHRCAYGVPNREHHFCDAEQVLVYAGACGPPRKRLILD